MLKTKKNKINAVALKTASDEKLSLWNNMKIIKYFFKTFLRQIIFWFEQKKLILMQFGLRTLIVTLKIFRVYIYGNYQPSLIR